MKGGFFGVPGAAAQRKLRFRACAKTGALATSLHKNRNKRRVRTTKMRNGIQRQKVLNKEKGPGKWLSEVVSDPLCETD